VKGLWHYWVHWRPTFWDDMTDAEDAALGPHSDYVGQLYDQGLVVLGGAVSEPPGGVVFFYADGRDEAEAIMKADPLYSSGIVEIKLHEFRAGFVGGTSHDFRTAVD